MNYIQIRQQIKNEALNRIAKIYHPLYRFPYSKSYGWYDDVDNYSYSEQREQEIQNIIKRMNSKLKKAKNEMYKRNNP